MRAWYCMLGCLLCVGLAPPARGNVIYQVELTDVISQNGAPTGAIPWLVATFAPTDLDPNATSVILTLEARLGTLSEFISDVAFCAPDLTLSTLVVTQLATVPALLPPLSPDSPVADLKVVSSNAENLPAIKGFDVKISWPTSNTPDRYSGLYNHDRVQFELEWKTGTSGVGSAFEFINALAGLQNDPRKKPSDPLPPGGYFMGAHVQGIPGGLSSTIGGNGELREAPEPGSLILAGMAAVGLVWNSRRGRRLGAQAAGSLSAT